MTTFFFNFPFTELESLWICYLVLGAKAARAGRGGLVPGHARWKEGTQPAAAKPFSFAFSPDISWRELWQRHWSEKQVMANSWAFIWEMEILDFTLVLVCRFGSDFVPCNFLLILLSITEVILC